MVATDARPAGSAESAGLAGSVWPALDGLVDGVLETRRRVAAGQAAQARLLAAAVDAIADRVAVLRQEAQQQGRGRMRSSDTDLPLREVALELTMALRVSDRGVQRRMSEAFLLREHFPTTLQVWESGQIDAGHAWAISRTGMLLRTPDDRARYETLALEAAHTESPARMTAAVKVIAASIDPDAFTDATDRAYQTRSVRLFDLDDGMARLIADLPAPLAYAIHDALTSRAHHILHHPEHPDHAADDGPATGDGDHTDGNDGGCLDDGSDGGEDRGGRDDSDLHERSREAGGRDDSDPEGAGAAEGGRDRHGQSVLTGTAPPTTDSGNTNTAHAPCGNTTPVQEKDHRTLAQIRADILSDLLLTTTATGAGLETVTAQIQVTIPALTLTGHPDAGPAILTGYGPIHPALKHHTTWHLRHPGNGTLQWTSPTGRHHDDHPPSRIRFVPTTPTTATPATAAPATTAAPTAATPTPGSDAPPPF